MKSNRAVAMLLGAMAVCGGFWGVAPTPAAAYWDTLEGPIGRDARQALDTGDAVSILKWVRLEDEQKARATLQTVVSLRAKYPEHAKDLDRSFFGTLLTIRRDGERPQRANSNATGTP